MELDGQPWFVAADVCRVLGIANVSDACSKLGQTEIRSQRLGDGRYGRPSLLVYESGLYKLIMRSDKPEAKAFQDWVTREVLPAIRKDGGYILGEEKVRSGESLGGTCGTRHQQRTPSARHGPRGGSRDEDAPVHPKGLDCP